MGLSPYDYVLLRERGGRFRCRDRQTDTHTQREKPCENTGGLERCVCKPRVARSHERQGRILPWGLQCEADTWSQMSGFQKYERSHFCCFKMPRLWQFVMAALGRYKKAWRLTRNGNKIRNSSDEKCTI